MESHRVGTAIIQDSTTDLLIVIPTKKNVFGIVYTCAWLCVWLTFELLILATANGNAGSILFLLAWTILGLFVFRSLIWALTGKEFIAIDKDTLIIQKKGLLLSTPKQYDTSKLKNVRIEEDRGGYVGQFVLRKNLLNAGADGIVRFEYGTCTVKFAEGIGKGEALAIMQEIKDKQYLTDTHFSSTN
jgi:hypothetical protein